MTRHRFITSADSGFAIGIAVVVAGVANAYVSEAAAVWIGVLTIILVLLVCAIYSLQADVRFLDERLREAERELKTSRDTKGTR